MADLNAKKTVRKPVAKPDIQFGVPSEHGVVAEAHFERPVEEPVVDATEALVETALHANDPVAVPLAIEIQAAEPVVSMKEEAVNEVMNDTMAATTEAMKPMADMSGKLADMFKLDSAKDAMAKGKQSMEELAQFNRGNVEALVESAKVAAKGAQEIAAYSTEYAKGVIAKANDNREKFTSVKSPTEFFQLGQELAKANMDELVAQASKFTEGYLKLVGEVVQPLQNRYALAAEKVKSVAQVG